MRRKIIIVFLMLYSFLAVLGFVWYNMAAKTIQVNTINLSHQIIHQMSDRVDYYLKDIEDLLYPIITSPETASYIVHADNGPYERLLQTIRMKRLFDNLMVGRSDIYGLSVVSQEGLGGSTYSNMFAEERFANIVEQLTRAGKFELIGIHHYNDTPLLTMAAKFFSPSTWNWGIVVVDLKMNAMNTYTSDVKLGDNGRVWIADSKGRYLFHPDRAQLGQPIPESYQLQTQEQMEGADIERLNGQDLLVTYGKSSKSHLTFYSEVPLVDINKDLIALRNITVIVGMMIFAISLIVPLTITMSLTDSILVIQRMMKKVESGNLDVRAPETKKGEIGYLYRRFNTMLVEVKNLIRTVSELQVREKEIQLKQLDSRMQALQYQINPHFLYNTLEIVNSHAIVEDVPVISRIVQSLASIFRYSADNHAKTVPLSLELNYMKDYMDIQMERFEKLKVEIDIAEQYVKAVRIVPMTLQPLLENAFKHGYQAHNLEALYISVRGVRDNDLYHIDIEDRGHGMALHTKERYNEMFRSAAEKEFDVDGGELGLWNVHRRIRLFFGERYGLTIIRSDLEGTIIRASFPYEQRKLG